MKQSENSLNEFKILGGEKQAAVSLASAFPEIQFEFLTDYTVVDGWDMANVQMKFTTPTIFLENDRNEESSIPLCSRWVKGGFCLSDVLTHLSENFKSVLVPVFNDPRKIQGTWIKKGKNFRKPDFIEKGSGGDLTSQNSYGCGVLYQKLIQEVEENFQVVGRVLCGKLVYGIIKVHREAFGREAFLIAGETQSISQIEEVVPEMVSSLELEGFFTMNWIKNKEGKMIMTSLRPITKAVHGTLKEGGVNLLFPDISEEKPKSGVKFVIEQYYSSYHSKKND